MKTCMFLCFHVSVKHDSTKTSMLPCKVSIPFSAHWSTLTPPITSVKNLLSQWTSNEAMCISAGWRAGGARLR